MCEVDVRVGELDGWMDLWMFFIQRIIYLTVKLSKWIVQKLKSITESMTAHIFRALSFLLSIYYNERIIALCHIYTFNFQSMFWFYLSKMIANLLDGDSIFA